MIVLLLNVTPFQVKIDTGVVSVTAISEEYSGNCMDGVTLRETGISLHGPAKQPPANNVWAIHRHDYYSGILR